ncbi:MAG TPA: conjugative transposon protein TraM [Puia sp.]
MLKIIKDKRLRLLAPLVAVPSLYLLFFFFGKSGRQDSKTPPGLNTVLPRAAAPKQSVLDKFTSYEKARQDSLHRQQEQHRDITELAPPLVSSPIPAPREEKADQLAQQLNQLQKALDRPAVAPVHHPTSEPDPQLDRLNGMLDKVLRIQHPTTEAPASSAPVDEAVPVDSASNTIAVTVPERQVLTAGATIALRLEDDVRVGKVIIPRGGLVYGTVSISNDRLLVHINTLRSERNIYTADLTAYDLDGLPGIHIPEQLSREVAKQSADQGLTGLNLMAYDPSLGAQAANAGIQTAKSLFSRKVRQVRVTVRAGYRLLLRNPRNNSITHSNELLSVGKQVSLFIRPPGFVPGGPLLKEASEGDMELGLQGIYLQDEVLWFALSAHNNSPITYIPEYIRWFIRDRRVLRRTAVQELSLEPIYTSPSTPIAGDSTRSSWTGFHPFALNKDKELVIEMGEKSGGRLLQLVLRSKDWKTIKKSENEAKEE